jgi:A/G-specific adenine glycosylase
MDNTTPLEKTVWAYYHAHGRSDLPWRAPATDGSFDPYRILVSEIMLQQTQVPRVTAKFLEFMGVFPNTYALAHGSLAEVLRLWNGLGYNRRAKFLWQAAGMIETEYGGIFPEERTELMRLPGVGPNTAGAIMAYAWNRSVMFLETNVRTVFIHHFFEGESSVSDAMLVPLVTASIPAGRAREWYWALMDYGTHLKQTTGNAARASKTYVKQSPFEGSRRQLRGGILRVLLEHPRFKKELTELFSDERLPDVLEDLVREGLVQSTGAGYAVSVAA